MHTDKNGGETVKVKFVDYGNSEQVPLTSLATIPPHLLTLPVQAVRCCLHDVEGPGVDGQWSEEVGSTRETLRYLQSFIYCTCMYTIDLLLL